MTPSFSGRQLASVVKSMTSGRDFDSADGVEHAVPIIRAETKNVAMAKGQEERSAAMPKEHGTPGLVHREVAPLRRLRCAHDFDRLPSYRAMEFAALRRKLPGVEVVLTHLSRPVGSEGAMGGARHRIF